MEIYLSLLVFISCATISYAYTSGIYVDNHFQKQTVLVDKLHGNHKRAIKQEILNLLGLEKRPKPTSKGTKYSAPHYMLDLYQTLEFNEGDLQQEDEHDFIVKRMLQSKNLTLPGMEDRVGQADMIMSFVHHSEYIIL